jgi:hypothetical protein
MDPELLFITNEAWFHFRCHVSVQNVPLRSDENAHSDSSAQYFFLQTVNSECDENLHAIQQVPLYSVEIWEWRAGVHGDSWAHYFFGKL